MAVTSYYCTWDDVVGRLGADGADRRTDDDPSRRTDLLRRATVKVNEYLLRLYSATALANSDWVREACADVAAYYACGRRNNPAGKTIATQYEETLASLKEMGSGVRPLPDAAQRKASAPVLSNQRVQLSPVPHTVTVPGTSTGTPAGYSQHRDAFDPLDYSI